MSRAFIKEDAGDPDELPERPRSSAPNYVTPAGLDALRRKAVELKTASAASSRDERRGRELARELRYYEARIASAILVDAAGRPGDEVRFGATVTVQDETGSRIVYAIVGQDEAEEGGGKIGWDSGPALALIGARLGDSVTLSEGESARRVKVVAITYQ